MSITAEAPPPAAPAVARGPHTERRRSYLRAWLWSGAILTFLILVIGGVTRLTQSGLSIVTWEPVVGVVPPLNEAQWMEAFDAYRASPEYQQLRQGMTMNEFKFIFFWEYIHRVAARLIGLVFLVPFLVFWRRGYLNGKWMRRALVLFALGAMQGVMGWLMVASGLVDQPHVSHYRLAAHLALAFAIFGCCVWWALDLRPRRALAPVSQTTQRFLTRGLLVVGVLFGLQVLWGALVAGLKAGLLYNTFPLMGASLVPYEVWQAGASIRPLLENPIVVQWVHRVLGTALALAVLAVSVGAWAGRTDRTSRVYAGAFLGLTTGQYALGVATLLLFVPLVLGVAHQAAAMVLFGVWLAWLHHTRRLPVHVAPQPA
jgi:heme a synthase